ncbi:hypothetical protein GCM10022279_25830 [Comamonas faecalis]|uniref:DUF3077 domain-containing protein n=1 Tax=Comamonas faecalis TaxID=1387849 RepID=A0ABP7RQP3_9BURK
MSNTNITARAMGEATALPEFVTGYTDADQLVCFQHFGQGRTLTVSASQFANTVRLAQSTGDTYACLTLAPGLARALAGYLLACADAVEGGQQ